MPYYILFVQSSPLEFVRITKNTFDLANGGSLFSGSLLTSLRIKREAHVDFSNNQALITQEAFPFIQGLQNARHLSLRGNPIDSSAKIPRGLFQNFGDLEYLDLGK